jgi:hypothetical protein
MNAESEVRRALDLLHPTTKLIELRPVMPDGHWWQGLYDCREKLVRSILSLNEIEATAVYWTINSIAPTGRVTNRLAPAKKGQCTKNADIDHIHNLFLDLDPIGSRQAVEQLAADVEAHVTALGWPKALKIDSGRGIYLFYRVDLPPTEAKLIRATIHKLAARFNTPDAIIDTACANAARIARVPGTFNRKGQPRMAKILEAA